MFLNLWFGGDVFLHAKILQQNPSALNDLLPHDMKPHTLKKRSSRDTHLGIEVTHASAKRPGSNSIKQRPRGA
jgi:hypothetical protein